SLSLRSSRAMSTRIISCINNHSLSINTQIATTPMQPLSLHDALPISPGTRRGNWGNRCYRSRWCCCWVWYPHSYRRRQHWDTLRSEEHTSELQSRFDLVCRLLLEKKKNKNRRLIKLENIVVIVQVHDS